MRTRTAAPEAEEPDPKNAATISRSALMDGKIVPGGGWHMLIGYVSSRPILTLTRSITIMNTYRQQPTPRGVAKATNPQISGPNLQERKSPDVI
jgi:hypothetical protein